MISTYFVPEIGLLPFLIGSLPVVGRQSQLPVYEIPKTTINTQRARISHLLRGDSSSLSVNYWRLAHAVKKADCAKRLSICTEYLSAMGFLIENTHMFDWKPDNLRLINGMADIYSDISRTSLSGRIGQGSSILFLENKGYAFLERFSGFLKRNGGENAIQRILRGKRGNGLVQPKTPDFIFEKHSSTLSSPEKALVESKGAFIVPGKNPNIKGDLKAALEQLSGWERAFTPSHTKSFAVGTYLREEEDISEPSLIAFVDPEPTQTKQEPVQYPPHSIRQANYSNWLFGMGFGDLIKEIQVPLTKIGNKKYIIAINSIRPKDFKTVKELMRWLKDWNYGLPRPYTREVVFQIMGIECDVLKKVLTAVRKGNGEGLMSLKPSQSSNDTPGFAGSFFADGTILGELKIDFQDETRFETMTL